MPVDTPYPTMPDSTRRFLYYWLPVALYCALIFFQSGRPVTAVLPAFPGMDKLLHFSAYALLGILFARAFKAQLPAATPLRRMTLAGLATTLYGASDEFHQSFVPMRMADPMDFLADATGALAGVMTHHRLLRPHSRPH